MRLESTKLDKKNKIQQLELELEQIEHEWNPME
jgi:hypothetical protein